MRGEVHILAYCPIDTFQWGSTHSALVVITLSMNSSNEDFDLWYLLTAWSRIPCSFSFRNWSEIGFCDVSNLGFLLPNIWRTVNGKEE